MLFAAATSLLDTTDGVMMVSAYRRTLENPLRRLYYNLGITLLSVAAAVSIGAIQLARVLLQLAGSPDPLRDRLAAFGDHSSPIGGVIVAMFMAVWLASLANGRVALPVLRGGGADA